jgi:hypothetical protein
MHVIGEQLGRGVCAAIGSAFTECLTAGSTDLVGYVALALILILVFGVALTRTLGRTWR